MARTHIPQEQNPTDHVAPYHWAKLAVTVCLLGALPWVTLWAGRSSLATHGDPMRGLLRLAIYMGGITAGLVLLVWLIGQVCDIIDCMNRRRAAPRGPLE